TMFGTLISSEISGFENLIDALFPQNSPDKPGCSTRLFFAKTACQTKIPFVEDAAERYGKPQIRIFL
ncbi:MAG: hypothetical protein AAF399_13825, partial [Bacteroidota bacterium]